jgi:hypothetical protein
MSWNRARQTQSISQEVTKETEALDQILCLLRLIRDYPCDPRAKKIRRLTGDGSPYLLSDSNLGEAPNCVDQR